VREFEDTVGVSPQDKIVFLDGKFIDHFCPPTAIDQDSRLLDTPSLPFCRKSPDDVVRPELTNSVDDWPLGFANCGGQVPHVVDDSTTIRGRRGEKTTCMKESLSMYDVVLHPNRN
jgi:hypothetical protein